MTFDTKRNETDGRSDVESADRSGRRSRVASVRDWPAWWERLGAFAADDPVWKRIGIEPVANLAERAQ